MAAAIICPNCGKIIDCLHGSYYCQSCQIDYTKSIVDISYKDENTALLSNIYPHKFMVDGIVCLSMETFIQSLRINDEYVQKYFCGNYQGMPAYKASNVYDWRKAGIVYWKGEPIKRNSQEYRELINRAYDGLLNNVFFKFALKQATGKILIHTIGCDDPAETLLTREEYEWQLKRLQKKLIE